MADLKGDLASLRIDREGPARQSRGWVWILAVLLVAAGGVAAWAMYGRSAVEVETVQPTVTSAGRAAPGTAILTASGYVVARRKAVVSAKIQGRLAELKVEEGSRVAAGEVLARLEAESYQAQLQRARAQRVRAQADLDELKRQLRVAQRLAAEKVLAADDLEASQSRVAVAEAGLAQADAEVAQSEAFLQDTVIRAPFAGTVVKKMAEVGESVAPIPPGVNLSTSSGAIVALADLDTLEVEADVAEANVAKLSDNQPAEVSVEAFPDKRYRAVLRQVIPTADRTKATVMVKVTIVDKDPNLKPEMSAKATFLSQEAPPAETGQAERRISVPEAAVVQRDGAAHVFEVRSGKARLTRIEAGPAANGQVPVTSGLSGSEALVARPPEGLKDGDAVKTKG